MGDTALDVYHCLVTTRPGEVPQLRDLNCEAPDEVEIAVALTIREWSGVHQVEVFRNGETVALFAQEDITWLAGSPAKANPMVDR